MVIKIGTDCSGIDAPIMALKRLKIPYKHLWSCDIDKYARQSIIANYSTSKNNFEFYDDITKNRKLPKVDIYVAGFPCQTFSTAGHRTGIKDPKGTIFWDCVKAIKKSEPKIFILENVKGLITSDDGNTFKTIIKTLERLKIYNIYWKVLNSCDYGVPQNRQRVFIVGLKKDYQKKEFEWPTPKKLKDIYKIVEDSLPQNKLADFMKRNIKERKINDFVDMVFVGIGPRICGYDEKIPTITTNSRIYCKRYKRFLNIKELLALQGFPKNFKQVVSDSQMRKQIGNSMTVDIIMELYKSIFNVMKKL